MDRMFEFCTPAKLMMGIGACSKVDVVRSMGTKALIVSDPGIVGAGIVEKVTRHLDAAGMAWELFGEVEPEPPKQVIDACAARVVACGADLLIGVGGGSSMDTAKTAAVVAKHGGPIDRYIGIGLVPARGFPTVLLPTTSGTGSEMTPIAVLTDVEASLKKGVVSEHLYADVAIVDPELVVTAHPDVTGSTGLDTLTHAVEAYTNRFALPFVDTLALQSIRLVHAHLRRAVMCGDDLDARAGMALAATYGGMCLGSVNTTAVHALAYPLGGTFHIPHGVANSLLLPYVMVFNLPASLERYAEIARALGERTEHLSLRDSAQRAVEAVRDLAQDVEIPMRLRDLDIPRKAIPDMAAAAVQVTRLMKNNPRRVTVEDAQRIYEEAF